MKLQTCCFTGHRIIPRDQMEAIQEKTEKAIIGLIHQGITSFVVGGAKGFDTLAAEIVIGLKKQFPYIQLILVLPFCSTNPKLYKTKKR